MKLNCKICLLLFFIMAGKVLFGQCGITLVPGSTNNTCPGCNNGTVSVSVSGGTGPYTYSWTNSVSAGTVNIAPLKDNTIYEENTGNSNGAGQNIVAGQTNAGFKNRALLAFDIAGNIPPGASIINASLHVRVLFTSGTTGPQTHSLYKLLQNWGEGSSAAVQAGQGTAAATSDATWLKSFYPGTDWTTAGGTFAAMPSASAVVDAQDITYTWSSALMAADVQSWLNSPSTNFGWLLKAPETGNKQAKRYGSRENVVPGNAPFLTVNYGAAVIGNTNSISNLAPGTYTVTVTDINGCVASTNVTVTTGSGIVFPEAAIYRGAFAAAPTAMWTDGWTNWDPQQTNYPTSTVTIPVNTVITGAVTWTRNNTYKIQGLVYVDSLATLTIEPGTVIRGDQTVANSSLVVQRGGKLIANGTPCNPIVFTSNKAAGSRAKGDWGGIILLGKASNNLGTQHPIEGIAQPNARVFHGGTNDADNSGSLKYVRIEYGGYVFAANNEVNGLTFGSVGNGTTVDYVQVSFSNDDAFEWFGGTVNCKHLVSYRNLDDDLDTDNGYSGTVQYALCVKDPQLSDDPAVSTSEGFESENNPTGNTATPKTSGKFYNITQIGAFRCTSNAGGITQPSAAGFRRGLNIRRNAELKICNSILMNNWRGLIADNTIPLAAAEFRNNIIAMDTTTLWTGNYAGVARIGEDAFSTNWFSTASYNNSTIATPCDLLLNAWDYLNPDYRPNILGSGAALAGTDLSPLIEIDNALFSASQGQDFLATILENGMGASNGIITISIPRLSGWNITVPGLTLTSVSQPGSNTISNVSGGTLNSNGNWNFRDDGINIIATSKPGVAIARQGFVQIGFRATRKNITPNGTNQSLAAYVSGGNDNELGNNGTVNIFSAN